MVVEYADENILVRRIDGKFIVRLPSKNQWIQLEPPAFDVFIAFTEGSPLETISENIAAKYSLDRDQSDRFIQEIILYLSGLPDYIKPESGTAFPSEQLSPSPPTFFSTHIYRFHDKNYRISYGSALLEYMIHPSFAHLELEETQTIHHQLEVFRDEELVYLKAGELAWKETDANRIKRRLFIELSGLIYNRSDKDWLTIMHASSVSQKDECIVFMSESGSGKSTLAALMVNAGLTLEADDYVVADAASLKVMPFPAALSVKNGAMPMLITLFPSLQSARTYHFRSTHKTIKYLPFPAGEDFYQPKTTRAVIFVRYDPDISAKLTPLSIPDALQRFNNDAWITDRPEYAGKFIDWFAGLKFYSLEYSDNEMAVGIIKELFGDR